MLDMIHAGKISKEKVVEKMCHAPAECFQIVDRGYLEEGQFADIAVVDPELKWEVNKENILYKCGWSPFEGNTFKSRITHTFVNGHLAFENGVLADQKNAMRLTFDR